MQSAYVQYKVIFNRKNELNKEGKALIQVRAYHEGKSRFFGTGIYIAPNDWNAKKMQPKDPILLRKIEQFLHELKQYEFEVRTKCNSFQISNFDQYGQPIEPVKPTNVSFTVFFGKQLEEERQLAQPSWRIRRRSYDVFKEFRKDVLFTEVNYELVHKFGQFLESKRFHPNTIYKHQKHLRKYVLLALRYKHIIENPFQYFPLKQVETNAQFLTVEEVGRLESLAFTSEQWRLEKSRDMFLFSCFTGLRYSDVEGLRPKDFINAPEGLELEYRAQKTGKFGKKYLYLMYEGKPQAIARKYISVDENRPLFRGLTNPKVNKDLKQLAKMAAIHKHICFKDSRDTFGTDMITKVDFRVVQDELQHTSPNTTKKYVQMNDELKKQRLTQIKW
ncbi:site-specific integrase [Runella aurantiaca]|uniref:Site-specific integrase n=1 Tax=Runella aurantiaca TaxID=2282308 RepID=A0A369IG25_9BACT|nr:site-specific integrase [Runella aurantiaca]RDB05606.1 site-specific integrase [Runella aurantiaca]